MIKLSKKGQDFLAVIEGLVIPSRKFIEEIGDIFFSQDDRRTKLGYLHPVLKYYSPNCNYRIDKLRSAIISHYREMIPAEFIRSDGRLKNNALKLVSNEEIKFLIGRLEGVKSSNDRLLGPYWSLFWKAYLEEEHKQ